jgi:hypothetical protein
MFAEKAKIELLKGYTGFSDRLKTGDPRAAPRNSPTD